MAAATASPSSAAAAAAAMAAAAASVAAPVALPVTVDTTGAQILEPDAEPAPGAASAAPPSTQAQRDGRDIYLPNHVESVSHIALDIGGSLAKVVYFTHACSPESAVGSGEGASSSATPTLPLSPAVATPDTPTQVAYTADGAAAVPSGTLTPTSISRSPSWLAPATAGASSSAASALRSTVLARRSLPAALPGGRLNFIKFETADIASLLSFLHTLISSSAAANRVSLADMRRSVCLSATGGGAHLFCERLQAELGVEVRREDEMRALITGLNFATLIPDEVFSYSDELVAFLHSPLPASSSPPPGGKARASGSRSTSPPSAPSPDPLPRPSADPPLYAPVYDSQPSPRLPCLLVNIGSGVSIIKVDDFGAYERVSGTSLGGGTLWGLLSLLTDADSFDEMLDLSTRGDNAAVDMLVGDIYGSSDALSSLGLKSSTIASSFGKVFRKEGGGKRERRKKFRPEDICKSLLYAISNNIGQIAFMNAEKYNLDRIYFGGCFIRGHQATISTLSYAIRFWSKGTKRAFFLRHEGYLGAIGAWLRHVGDPAPREASGKGFANGDRPLGVPTPVAELPEPSLTNGFPSPAARHVSNPLAAPQARAPFSPLAQSNGDEPPSARRPALSASMPPALLEALGGVSLDAHAPPPALANGDAHEQEEHEPDAAEEEDEDEDEEAPSDLAALLASLSPEDAALLGPLLSSGPGSKGEPDVLELLARMDAAEDAAVGLEERLDGFLGRLDGLLQEQEARQGEQPSDGAQEHSSPRPQ